MPLALDPAKSSVALCQVQSYTPKTSFHASFVVDFLEAQSRRQSLIAQCANSRRAVTDLHHSFEIKVQLLPDATCTAERR